ncbi:MAG TPA: DUF4352 domain-containing protein [Terriglobales bacterium]|nr:DUF4352 domain-containing protein [Terriglobales bacterium]
MIRLAVGALVLFLLWSVFSKDKQPDSSLPHEQEHVRAVDQVTPPTYELGQEVTVGYWTYRCNKASWQPAIWSGYSSLETPDATFLIVDISIRNNDRTASTLPPLKLIDAQGREYKESSKGVLMPGRFDVLKELNPGVSSRGNVVFDVPHGLYKLQLSGGFYSAETATVNLPSNGSEGPSSRADPGTETSPAPSITANQGPPSEVSETKSSPEDKRPPQEAPQIEKGQTPDQVEAAFGHPDKVSNLDGKLIWVYKDFKVTFLNGRVTDAE